MTILGASDLEPRPVGPRVGTAVAIPSNMTDLNFYSLTNATETTVTMSTGVQLLVARSITDAARKVSKKK